MEVFRQRIEEESGLDVIIAAPSITYRAKPKYSDEIMTIETPEEYPDNTVQIEKFGAKILINNKDIKFLLTEGTKPKSKIIEKFLTMKISTLW